VADFGPVFVLDCVLEVWLADLALVVVVDELDLPDVLDVSPVWLA
jgi:hypothetical protein